jgi:hypothetical protein
LIFSIAIILSGCSKRENDGGGGESSIETSGPAQQEETFSCPLNGMAVEKKEDTELRPIAVMVDNEYNARPQSGLIDADIVYEMPAEGNITRYMAIFHHNSSDKIGPVRSARPYFIDTALEFNAVYVHCGGSPQALKDIKTLKVETLNDLKGSPCFWRSKDRKMPHNLYTSTKLMREVMEKQNFKTIKPPQYFSFNTGFSVPEGKNTGNIIINYFKNYEVEYRYNDTDSTYTRYVNGSPLKDKESGEEVKAVNIIVERVKNRVLDDKGRLEIENIGTNPGYYISGGKYIDIQCVKESRSGRTIYRDLSGNEILLNRGSIWIQVVPESSTVKIGE